MGQATCPTCGHEGADASFLTSLLALHRGSLERRIRLHLDRRILQRLDESDILQEAYLEALRRLAAGGRRPAVRLSQWFWSLTRQKIVDTYRFHLGTRRRDLRRETREEGVDRVPLRRISDLLRGPSNPESPVEEMLRSELSFHVQSELRTLRPQDQKVLLLRLERELSFHELADALGISPTAAMKRYHRALRRCRRQLLRLPGILLEPWVSSP